MNKDDKVVDGHGKVWKLVRKTGSGVPYGTPLMGDSPFSISEYNIKDWDGSVSTALIDPIPLELPETQTLDMEFHPWEPTVRQIGHGEMKTMVIFAVYDSHIKHHIIYGSMGLEASWSEGQVRYNIMGTVAFSDSPDNNPKEDRLIPYVSEYNQWLPEQMFSDNCGFRFIDGFLPKSDAPLDAVQIEACRAMYLTIDRILTDYVDNVLDGESLLNDLEAELDKVNEDYWGQEKYIKETHKVLESMKSKAREAYDRYMGVYSRMVSKRRVGANFTRLNGMLDHGVLHGHRTGEGQNALHTKE